MICNDCGRTLEETEVDCRQEWREIYYFCENCNIGYVRRTEYAQDGLVISDKIKKEE